MRCNVLLLFILLGVVFGYSCKKPVLNDNGTLPNNSLGVVFCDTLTVKSYTVLEDSLRSDNQAVNVLGAITDPVFGKTFASIYSQFSLPTTNLTLGTGLTVDSVVLSLKYLGSYGNLNVPMSVLVYRINQRYYYDSTYYSNRTFPIQSTLLGALYNYTPHVTTYDSIRLDSTQLNRDTLVHAPQMRIRLSNSLGTDLLNQSGSANVATNDAFLNYFNGLYITPDTTKPGSTMVYLDMAATDTKLTVYYRSTSSSNSAKDTVLTFYANTLAKVVGHFQHNYANSSVANFLGSNNTNGDSLIFAQSLAGVKAKIFVPYIKNLGNIAINKAELMFSVVSDSTNYGNPAQVFAYQVDSLGLNKALDDQTVGSSYFGGYKLYESTSLGNVTRYRINLSRYYQEILQGKVDSGIYVFPTPPNREADRAVFGGGTHSKLKVKLNLTYTKIN